MSVHSLWTSFPIFILLFAYVSNTATLLSHTCYPHIAVGQMVFVKHPSVKSPQPRLDTHVAPRCSILPQRAGRHHMGAVFHSQHKLSHITDRKILDTRNECYMNRGSFHYLGGKKCMKCGGSCLNSTTGSKSSHP